MSILVHFIPDTYEPEPRLELRLMLGVRLLRETLLAASLRVSYS